LKFESEAVLAASVVSSAGGLPGGPAPGFSLCKSLKKRVYYRPILIIKRWQLTRDNTSQDTLALCPSRRKSSAALRAMSTA